MQITDVMVKALRRELKTFKPDDQLRRALTAALSDQQAVEVKAPEGWELVPKSAIMWLIGAGPDSYGNWFEKPEGAPAFWWRTHFNKLRADAAKLRSALVYVPAVEPVDDEETYQIGVRDGYSQAVQEIDRLTGGDGEYRYCTDHDPDRHTPGPAEMIQRIVDRFEVLNLLDDASKTGRDQEWGDPLREGEDSAEVKDADETVQKLCDMHGKLLRVLDEKTGLKFFMADEVSSIASLLLDAATKIDRANRSALAATRSGSATSPKGCAE